MSHVASKTLSELYSEAIEWGCKKGESHSVCMRANVLHVCTSIVVQIIEKLMLCAVSV